MKKILVSALAALAMVVGGAVPAQAVGTQTWTAGSNTTADPIFTGAVSLAFGSGSISRSGDYTFFNGSGAGAQTILVVENYLAVCDTNPTAFVTPISSSWATISGTNNCFDLVDNLGRKQLYSLKAATGQSDTEVSSASVQLATNGYYKRSGGSNVAVSLDSKYLVLVTRISASSNGYFILSDGVQWGASSLPSGSSSSSSSSYRVPQVPVFKQPKFAMPSKIDVDTTGKVSLSGKDMGVSTVLIGGKEQKIDTNSDEKLVFDTTGLAKGVHDLVMKGAFGTYTVQKAIQVGEAVVTKVAAVSARQVGMAGGELSISGVGLEGTTQITMNGQVLEIVSRTDSKVTFKVPASTVASVNSIMIEGSFVPVLFKNAFSYTK